jgi:hypothetical protein
MIDGKGLAKDIRELCDEVNSHMHEPAELVMWLLALKKKLHSLDGFIDRIVDQSTESEINFRINKSKRK